MHCSSIYKVSFILFPYKISRPNYGSNVFLQTINWHVPTGSWPVRTSDHDRERKPLMKTSLSALQNSISMTWILVVRRTALHAFHRSSGPCEYEELHGGSSGAQSEDCKGISVSKWGPSCAEFSHGQGGGAGVALASRKILERRMTAGMKARMGRHFYVGFGNFIQLCSVSVKAQRTLDGSRVWDTGGGRVSTASVITHAKRPYDIECWGRYKE